MSGEAIFNKEKWIAIPKETFLDFKLLLRVAVSGTVVRMGRNDGLKCCGQMTVEVNK